MSQAILTALMALDVTNDNHWTADGLPRLDTVKMLAANPTLTREAVSAAAPGFTRSNAATFTLPATEAGAGQAGEGGSTPAQAAQPGAQPGESTGQGDSTSPREAGAAAAPQPAANAASDSSEPAEEAEQPEVGGGAGSAADEVEALEAELEAAEAETEERRRAMERMKREFEEARAREDALRVKLDSIRPKDTNTDAIQAYLASQRKRLEERGARQQLIKESGLDLKALAKDLRAPIDAVRARKTGHGRG